MSGAAKDVPELPLELFDYEPTNLAPQIVFPLMNPPGNVAAFTGGSFYSLQMGPPRPTIGLELGPPVTLEQAKALHVQRVLAGCNGNLTKAARLLAISRRTLQRLIDRWGIERAPAPAELQGEALGTFAEAAQLHVQQVLEALAWQMQETARVLGIHRRTLYRLLERWGVQRPEVPS